MSSGDRSPGGVLAIWPERRSFALRARSGAGGSLIQTVKLRGLLHLIQVR